MSSRVSRTPRLPYGLWAKLLMAPAWRGRFWQAVNANGVVRRWLALRHRRRPVTHSAAVLPCRTPSRSVLKTASRTNLLGRRHSDGEEEEDEPPEESRLLSQRSDASNMASSIRNVADGDFREDREHRHFFR